MEKVTYVCAVTHQEVAGSPTELPSGWMIPPHDVSRDVSLTPLDPGVILCLSSKEVWQQHLNKRLTDKN